MNLKPRTFLVLVVFCIMGVVATMWYASLGTGVNGEVAPAGSDDIIIPIGADVIILFKRAPNAVIRTTGRGTIYIQGYLGRNVVEDYCWKYEDYNWQLCYEDRVLFLWRD